MVLDGETPGNLGALATYAINRRGVIHHALLSGAMNCAPTAPLSIDFARDHPN
jgi:hypothetical protein